MAARISIRKMGTRAGRPHYGATCTTCGTVIVVAHVDRETAKSMGDDHKRTGCQPTLRWAHNTMVDNAPLRRPRD